MNADTDGQLNDLDKAIERKRTEYADYFNRLGRVALRKEGFKDGAWVSERVKRAYEDMLTSEQVNKTKRLCDKAEPKIDIDMIELVHGFERQQDGFISFCRKVNDEHHNLAGVRVSKLREILPGILPWLLEDSFFSVNASYRAAPYQSKETGLPNAWRSEKVLRYLNACYVDLDCYKAGLDWGAALGIIARAQDMNVIPPASIVGRSGRGLYLLWLLTSEREGAQQRAFPHEIELYKQINRKLINDLNSYDKRLCADVRAVDAARILRTPGSVHTKASAPVVYIIQVTPGALVPTFTLNKLAELYQIPVTSALPAHENFYSRPIKKRGSCPARRRGKIATGEYRLQDILTICQNRQGFEHGRRRRSLTYVIEFAKAAGHTLSDIETLVFNLAQGCRPPYPSEENDTSPKDIIRDVWNGPTKRFKNDKLAKFFQVTPDLAKELNLHSIIPGELKQERDALPSPQEQSRQERRSWLKTRLNRDPTCSIRSLHRQLRGAGFDVSFFAVHSDIKALYSKP